MAPTGEGGRGGGVGGICEDTAAPSIEPGSSSTKTTSSALSMPVAVDCTCSVADCSSLTLRATESVSSCATLSANWNVSLMTCVEMSASGSGG